MQPQKSHEKNAQTQVEMHPPLIASMLPKPLIETTHPGLQTFPQHLLSPTVLIPPLLSQSVQL